MWVPPCVDRRLAACDGGEETRSTIVGVGDGDADADVDGGEEDVEILGDMVRCGVRGLDRS